MVSIYIEIVLQLISIGLVITAAGLWAGAGIDTRPKYRDEQTLVGGTIWSQIIIPIGLMISKIVEEDIDPFVQGYFLITGILLLCATGIILIIHEIKGVKRRGLRTSNHMNTSTMRLHDTYDRIYYGIGIVSIIAAMVKLSELIIIFVDID